MTLKYVCGATVVVFAFGMVTVGSAYAQRRDGALLPQEESGQVTAVGCLVRGDAVRGGKRDKYVLAHPKRGPVPSVTETTCTADPGSDALVLDNPNKGGMSDSMLGRWVEIRGRLEKETSKNPDNLRELDVATAKMVPVVIPEPPAAAAVRPSPPRPVTQPRPQSIEASAAPVAAAPEARHLPKTASHQPDIALAGLLLLSAGLILRSFRLRQRA